MEPKLRLTLQPDKKRPKPVEDVDDEKEPGDVDKDDDAAWDRWVNDESGAVEAPLPPSPEQPEMGIHAPTPEMDDHDRELQEEWEKRRKQEQDENDPNSLPRGVWEMKK